MNWNIGFIIYSVLKFILVCCWEMIEKEGSFDVVGEEVFYVLFYGLLLELVCCKFGFIY